jgi:hypothetical protein
MEAHDQLGISLIGLVRGSPSFQLAVQARSENIHCYQASARYLPPIELNSDAIPLIAINLSLSYVKCLFEYSDTRVSKSTSD